MWSGTLIFSEQNQFIREISEHGFAATFACKPAALDVIHRHGLQGVLYFKQSDDFVLRTVIQALYIGTKTASKSVQQQTVFELVSTR